MTRFAAPALLLALAAPLAPAADPPVRPAAADVAAVARKGYAALKAAQNADGSVGNIAAAPVATTAMAAAALVRHGYAPDDAVVAKMFDYLKKSTRNDGSVVFMSFASSTTAQSILAFNEANAGKRYDAAVAAAAKFLRTQQSKDPDAAAGSGGAGFDVIARPDLTNTHLFAKALLAAGAGGDDPAVRGAVRFVSRCQNLPGAFNDRPFAKLAADDDRGGFAPTPGYEPPGPGERRTAAGGLRSDAGATHEAIETLLAAGVGKGDPRVKAAGGWAARHYTLKENPGQGEAGVLHYYRAFAGSMAALGGDVFADAAGAKHPWRSELFDALKAAQKPDGRWANPKGGPSLEGQPGVGTALALLALADCK